MKRISISIIGIIMLLILGTKVQASGDAKININIPEEAKRGDEITATVQIENASQNICGVQGKLQYNSDVLEYVGNKILLDGWFVSGFNKTTGIFLGEVTDITDNSKFITGTKNVIEFTFKIKEDADLGNTNVGVTNIVLSGEISSNTEVMKTVKVTGETNQQNNSDGNNKVENNNEQNNSQEQTITNTEDDTTVKNTTLPKTGMSILITMLIVITSLSTILFYIKIKKYRGI